MHRILKLIFLLLLITSCKSEIKQKVNVQEQTETEKEAKPKKKNIKTDFISTIDYSEINKIIQGIWLPKKYLNDIQKTKSAYISSRSIPTIAELQIEPKEIKNDSLYVISSYNNHEGHGITIWFKNHNGKVKIKSKNFDFDFSTTENDTILKLISKDNKSTEYLRISNSKYISDYGGKGYEIVARKIILNGKYKVLDSVKNDLGIANFNAENGKIENFDFKKYQILTDYNEPTYEGDNLFLYKDEINIRNIAYYGIKREKDTLKLYSKKEYFENDEYGVKLDKVKYYLINTKHNNQ